MKWKCKASGNIINLPDYEDHNMEGHDGYEKVEEQEVKQQEEKKPTAAASKKTKD